MKSSSWSFTRISSGLQHPMRRREPGISSGKSARDFEGKAKEKNSKILKEMQRKNETVKLL